MVFFGYSSQIAILIYCNTINHPQVSFWSSVAFTVSDIERNFSYNLASEYIKKKSFNFDCQVSENLIEFY